MSFLYALAHVGVRALDAGGTCLMLCCFPQARTEPARTPTSLFAVLVHSAALLPSANHTCGQTPADVRLRSGNDEEHVCSEAGGARSDVHPR